MTKQEIIKEIKNQYPNLKGLSKLTKKDLENYLPNMSDIRHSEILKSEIIDFKSTGEKEKEVFDFERQVKIREFHEKRELSDVRHSEIKKSIKKLISGKANFQEFLKDTNLDNFPRPIDFTLNQYRKVLAGILRDYRKEVLREVKTSLKYKIGKDISIYKKYTGKSRFLPSTFSYNISKNFLPFWESILNQWDTSEESTDIDDTLSYHVNFLSSQLKTDFINESQNLTDLTVYVPIEEKEVKPKKQSDTTCKFPVNDSKGLLIGYSVIIKNNELLKDFYFLSI